MSTDTGLNIFVSGDNNGLHWTKFAKKRDISVAIIYSVVLFFYVFEWNHI